MSARRKGKPQQRRKIETAEQEQQDFITCGDCQHEFKLCDIVKFIQHKVNGCNKENVDPFENNDSPRGADDDDAPHQGSEPIAIGNRRTSISAPIAHRCPPPADGKTPTPRPSRELPSNAVSGIDSSSASAKISSHSNNDVDDDDEYSNEDADENHDVTGMTSQRRKRKSANAGSDHNSEPVSLTCVSCQLTVTSAWTLMQHAQHKHNICIYIDGHQMAPPHSTSSSVCATHAQQQGKAIKQEVGVEDQSEAKHSKRDCDDDNENDDGEDTIEGKTSKDHQGGRNLGQGHSSSRSTAGDTPQGFADGSGSGGDRRRSTSSAATPPREAFAHSQRSTPHSSRSSNSSPPINMGDLMSTTPPFLFRMPHSDRQQLSPAGPLIPPFGSPPDFRSQPDFRFGLPGMSPFQRMPGIPGFEGLHPGMPSNPFERPIRPPHMNDTNPFSHEMYSLRLRHLASGNTANKSPEALLKPPLTPPFSHQSSFFATSPTDPLRAGMALTQSSSKPYLPSGKPRNCEFCGKDFKFLSNLIVHRRSHTGEKPFRCPLCPHACSQASKLKRHMKTHRPDKESSPTNGMATKLSKLVDYIGREGDNGEDNDLDEEIAIEEARKFGLIDEVTDEVRIRSKSLTSPGNSDSDVSDLQPEEVNGMTSGSDKESRTALLTEVMEKSGLGSIQQYSDAFNQALEESTSGKDKNGGGSLKSGSDKSSENGERVTQNGHHHHGDDSDAHSVAESRKTSSSVTSNEQDSEPSVNGDHHSNGTHSHDRNSVGGGSASKRMKLDEAAAAEAMMSHHMPPFALGHMWPNPFMPGSLGGTTGAGGPPRPWPPGLGMPIPTGLGRHENGFGGGAGGAGGESAFTIKGNGAISNHHHHMGGSGLRPNGKPEGSRGRNDTCEFCGKFFKNASNLTVHRRTHTGEKPYQCRLCPYSCAQSSKLTRHMKIHGQGRNENNGGENKAYNCKFCNMPFSVPGTLEKHMRKCVENHGGNPHALAAANQHALAAALNPESPFSKPPSVASSETSNDSSNVA